MDFEFGGTTGFSDFFEQIFGGRARGGAGAGAARPGGFAPDDQSERGRDVEGEIMVTLEETMTGSVRAVTLRRKTECPTCHGTGEKGRKTCPTCGGSGQVSKEETYQVKIPAGVTRGPAPVQRFRARRGRFQRQRFRRSLSARSSGEASPISRSPA